MWSNAAVLSPDSARPWHEVKTSDTRPESHRTCSLFPTHLHPERPDTGRHLGAPGVRARRARRGAGMGVGADAPWEEAGHVTPEAQLGCQAGSAATGQEVAGAQPELRGTGRRGPGTADPGERPCHGEAGGRAGRAALEHGRFPAGPHRQPLPPAHARLPRTRYRVARGEAEDADSRGFALLELAGLLGTFSHYPPCPQRWGLCLSSEAALGTAGAPKSGNRFLGPTNPPQG